MRMLYIISSSLCFFMITKAQNQRSRSMWVNINCMKFIEWKINLLFFLLFLPCKRAYLKKSYISAAFILLFTELTLRNVAAWKIYFSISFVNYSAININPSDYCFNILIVFAK
jgi:hypothetical protein